MDDPDWIGLLKDQLDTSSGHHQTAATGSPSP
jgi:hypothetical protein